MEVKMPLLRPSDCRFINQGPANLSYTVLTKQGIQSSTLPWYFEFARDHREEGIGETKVAFCARDGL